MFQNCLGLPELKVTNFDTSRVWNMAHMFESCAALPTIDVSSFNTAQVTDMSYMFHACLALTTLDITNFDTSLVTKMDLLFTYCPALTSLDLSNFSTARVWSMRNSFVSCTALSSITLGSDFSFRGVSAPGGSVLLGSQLPDAPNNTGYTGLWQTMGTGDVLHPNGTVYTSTDDLALAHDAAGKQTYVWQPRALFTVHFDAHDGMGSMPDLEVVAGSSATLPALNGQITRSDYEFVNWNTNADGTGTSYEDRDSIVAGSAGDAITLYAQWRALYTITYDANGGTGLIASQVVSDGSQAILARTGFINSPHELV